MRSGGRRAITRIVHQHPAALAVVDDAALHAAGFLDDRVILTGIGRVREGHHEFVRASVDRAVDPEGRNVAERARSDFDRTDLALGQFEQHDPAAALAVVHLGPVRIGVDVAAGEEILASHFARTHTRDADDHVAGIRGRLVVRHFVDDFVAEFALQHVKSEGVRVETFKVGELFHIAIGRRQPVPRARRRRGRRQVP